MAFKTFTSGAVLTAAELNTYLMQQSVIVCTAATRPSAPVEGMTIYETDTDYLRTYTGAAWVTIAQPLGEVVWTPALTASSVNPTLGTGSTATGGYVRQGRLITFYAQLAFGTSGNAAGTGTYRVSLPFTAAATWQGQVIGAVELNNSGAGVLRTARIDTGGTYVTMAAEDGTAVTDAVPFVWGVSDYIRVSGSYVADS